MDSVQRLNYHTGLFLEETEFKLEQNYHMIMRQRINYAVFKPGVLYGMALDYTGGVLKVTAGMAIDETTDPDFGLIGRELVLVQDSDPVSLSSFSSGNTAWITAEYDYSLDLPKPPTNIASRVTQKVKITASSTNPGPGTGVILLGSIVIGTASHTDAVQKAVLRLSGAPAPLPLVSGFTPASGPVGTVVTITGTNFTGATAVGFGAIFTAATYVVNSPTQITATVPAGMMTGKIWVTTPAGVGGSLLDFTLTATAPAISNFSPASGSVGTTVVTITGSNFTGATGVSFGGVAATTFTVNAAATQVTATVPTGAVTGKIRVTTPAGFGESASNFTIIPAPTVTNVNPLTGAIGASVVITGTNLTGATEVRFGGVAATTFTVDSVAQITATVPAAAATGRIRVTTPGGFADSAMDLTVVPAPVIKSILPTSVTAGSTIVIRGSNIRGSGIASGMPATGTVVRFVDPGNSSNAVTATTPTVLTDVSATFGPQQVQVTVPSRGTLPAVVNVVLGIAGVSTTAAQQFTFL